MKVSGTISTDKLRPRLSYIARAFAIFLVLLFFIILCCHHASDVATALLSHWTFLLQPWARRRMPPLLPPFSGRPRRPKPSLLAYPATYFLISYYMLRMSFVNLLVGLGQIREVIPVANPLLVPLQLPLKPVPDPHDYCPARTRGRSPSLRLLHLGLLAAIAASDAVPTLSLASDKALKRDLRKYRGASGFVTKTSNIQPKTMSRLRKALEASPCHLLSEDDTFELIMDSGCSKSVSPHLSDFVPGSLVDLAIPLTMDGIAGQIVAHQKGRLRYEILNDAGEMTVLTCDGYHIPELKIRLFSPQVMLGEQKGGKYVLEWNSSYLELANGDHITIGYHRQTSLPVIRGFHNVLTTAKALALEGLVEPTASNLTSLQQCLFKWHTKWGHLGWQHTQWLGRCGIVGPIGVKMGSTNVVPPKCAACQLGKQERTPKPGATMHKHPDGVHKMNKLEPGDLISSDQYESTLLGRQFSARGTDLTAQKFRGGTIFCDAASAKLSVVHQVGLTGTETVQAKIRFEREAAAAGVHVKDYCSDNGIYPSKEFAAELISKGQGIRHSGVGAHHHNGVAENAIKITVRTARTMMIFAALRWPEHNDRDLWPLALSHAVHLHNELPSSTSRLTPHEVWTKSKSSFSALVNAHPWGCPVYVLQPRLQDGGKVPKWEPRSRQGQYMGASPLHASTVGLVRNLRTNHISPQFHVVYDDLFDTVHASSEEAPASWPDLFTFSRYKSDYDDEDFVPSLSDEWLTPVEQSQRQQQEQAQRGQQDDEDHDVLPPTVDEVPPSQRAPLPDEASPRTAIPDTSQRAPVVPDGPPAEAQPKSSEGANT